MPESPTLAPPAYPVEIACADLAPHRHRNTCVVSSLTAFVGAGARFACRFGLARGRIPSTRGKRRFQSPIATAQAWFSPTRFIRPRRCSWFLHTGFYTLGLAADKRYSRTSQTITVSLADDEARRPI